MSDVTSRRWRVLASTLQLGAVLCLLPAPALSQHITPQDLLSTEPIDPDHVSSYGSDPLQFGHLRLPEGEGPFPVLVVIHGGCWLSFADLQHLTPFTADIAEAGVATWSIEYRRVDSPGGGWPNTFLDVAKGVDHLRTLAAEYDLDLNRVVVVGHSSGGHLALWVAGRSNIPMDSPLLTVEPLAIDAVVSLEGATLETKKLRELDNRVCGGDVIYGLLGGTPEEVPDHYAAGSPERLLPFGVPVFLLTGGDLPIIPPEQVEAFAEVVRGKGDEVTVTAVAGSAHFEVVVPGTEAWPEVRSTILGLFETLSER